MSGGRAWERKGNATLFMSKKPKKSLDRVSTNVLMFPSSGARYIVGMHSETPVFRFSFPFQLSVSAFRFPPFLVARYESLAALEIGTCAG